MAEIHNLKELNELGGGLQFGDKIYFVVENNKIEYDVWGKYLCNHRDNDNNNAIVFDCLNLNISDKYRLAERCYGYKATGNEHRIDFWPECKYNDFQALERLIKEIYKRLGDNSYLDPKEFITNRFEILDL